MNERFTFRDCQDHLWDVTLTLGGAMRVDNSNFKEIAPDLPKFSLLEPSKTMFNDILLRQPVLFAMIFAVVKPQVKEHLGIDLAKEPERENEAQMLFVELLDGKALESAREAFWGTLACFFPEQKTVLSMLMQQWKEGRDLLTKEMEAMGPEVTEYMTKEIKAVTGQLRTAMKEGPAALAALKL